MSSSSIFVRRSSSLSTRQKSPFALGFLPQVILRNKVTFREGDLDFSTALDLIQYRSWIWLKAKVKGPFFSLLNGFLQRQLHVAWKLIISRIEGEPYFFTFGKSEVFGALIIEKLLSVPTMPMYQ
ncbi:uncharacterized protein LOC130745600 isoform X2 [Lotus japonicus]|nr:uncharacterized protein LOC130745600 isoform X2 [Lotus japonicus]